MASAHHSFFRRKLVCTVAAMSVIAGCSSSKLLSSPPELRLATVDAEPLVAKAVATKPGTLPLKASVDDKVQIRPVAAVGESAVPVASQGQSAWCRYLKEDSAAQATMLRSPTLNGSVDDTGKSRVSLGLSASSFNKAHLVQESAEIQCRKYLAEKGLQKLVFLAPQGLTAAGFRAKADAIQRERSALNGLRKLVRRELRSGNLTAEKATGFTVLIDQIIADGNSARSQADRRLTNGIVDPVEARKLGAELLRAEADAADMASRMRTADAFDVSVSAGWNDRDITDGPSSASDSFSGKVSFSVNLGSFAPSRFEHERKAKAARLEALQHEDGGLLWQVDVLRRAHENALNGLADSRTKLLEAGAEATRFVALMKTVDNPEFLSSLISARIQLIRIKAERAAVDGSIAEIKANMQKLNRG